MKSYFVYIFLSIAVLTGCVSPQQSRVQLGNIIVAEPVPISLQSQGEIAHYNRILFQAKLSDSDRAEYLFRRGVTYDRMGMFGLAQRDINLALQLNPSIAKAHNSLGIYYTQQMQFIDAYEAFDSALEIEPDFDYAFFNRGIALYYGGRKALAANDFQSYYQRDTANPYSAIWQYIAASEVDEQKALEGLTLAKANISPTNWAMSLVNFFLGEMTETQLLDGMALGADTPQELSNRLCEVYFYLGKYHASKGNDAVALTYFKIALSTNVHEFVEHRYARLEIDLIRQKAE